jgi:superfamily II RNA helicase
MLAEMFKRKDNAPPAKKPKIDPGYKPINTLNSKPAKLLTPVAVKEVSDTPIKNSISDEIELTVHTEPAKHIQDIQDNEPVKQEVKQQIEAPSIISSLQTQASENTNNTANIAVKEKEEIAYTEPTALAEKINTPDTTNEKPTPLFKKIKQGKESHNFVKLDLINGYREKGKIKKKSRKIIELEKQRMLNKIDKKYGGNGSYGVEGFSMPEQEEKMPSFSYGYALDPLQEKQSIVGKDTMEEFLFKQFNFKQFKNGQKEAITHLINGKSTLVILPTGAGKSLIFQFYALWANTTIIVITPLLSLMSDQVHN